jgi:hypothetical protein
MDIAEVAMGVPVPAVVAAKSVQAGNPYPTSESLQAFVPKELERYKMVQDEMASLQTMQVSVCCVDLC